jgi:hypothetical protein
LGPKDKKYHNTDIKPKIWDEVREKLNVKGSNEIIIRIIAIIIYI